MDKPLHILIVEDSEDDAALLRSVLRHGGYEVVYEVVDTPAAMRSALERQDWDVITSDHAMPHFSAPAALALAKELRPNVPFILLSEEIDLNLAVSLMKEGAQDYIPKRELPRIVPAIEREVKEAQSIIKRKQAQDALRESEERFRKLFERHTAVKLVLDPATGNAMDANEAAADFYGWSIEELKQMHIQQINTLPAETVKAAMKKAASSECSRFEFRHRRANGSIRDVEVFSNKIEIMGRDFLYSIIHDITDRKRAEEALDEERRRLKQALDEVRTLRGILPICANCKKIRDDKGYWNQVEKYVSEHTEAQFSHGICPDCLKRLYPRLYNEKS